ncbi:MAG: Na+/H+ antiporter subunit E [Lachnospiraceae bacterium]|nr:Na+/H+ antiporter subunit E [Lachnospiraceae bacterium]
MFILFFLIWIIFNGQFTLEIAAFGVVVAGAMYWFICKFLDYKPGDDLILCKRLVLIFHYVFVLLVEILKANGAVFKMIYSAKYRLEPAVVHFKTNLRTPFARVLLANSITLTPGTITVSLKDDEYVVHCLDKELAQGIDSSIFVKLLERIENVN